ncbi:MAG: signal peptidase I [Clostridium sp.]
MIINKKVMKEIRGMVFSVIGAICIVSIVNSKVLANVTVDGPSMDNTLHNGERLLVNKLGNTASNLKRGDIIIFLLNSKRGTIIDDSMENVKAIMGKGSNANRLVKRVIGVSGDEVDIRDGFVYLNNEKLDEPYVDGDTINGRFTLPVIVPEGKLFVLGDNRKVSKDSREFGLVDCNQVEGRAVYRVYPFDEMGKLK